jgi:putative phosphoribosyl transferase
MILEQQRKTRPLFKTRREAARRLASYLDAYQLRSPLLLAPPCGGILTGDELAGQLGAPLEVLVCRHLRSPTWPDFKLGALSEHGAVAFNENLLRELGVGRQELDEIIGRELHSLERRVTLFRRDRPLPPLEGRDLVLVDDFVDTGATLRAALTRIKREKPRRILLAAPVLTLTAVGELSRQVDNIIFLHSPESFGSASDWYEDSDLPSEGEMLALLEHRKYPRSSRMKGEDHEARTHP